MTEKKSSSSRLVTYIAVTAALLVTVLFSGTINNSSPSVQVPDLSQRAQMRMEVIGIVGDELGNTWQREMPKIQGMNVLESPDGHLIKVRFSIDESGLAGSTAVSAQEDVLCVMRALFQSQNPVASVRMTGTFPVTDPYGFVRETEVLKCGLSAATADGIDWGSISSGELFSRLDTLWWHSSIYPGE